jgi:hypothetical protein
LFWFRFLYVEKKLQRWDCKEQTNPLQVHKISIKARPEGVPLLKQKANFTNHHSEKTNESCKSTFKFNNVNFTCHSKNGKIKHNTHQYKSKDKCSFWYLKNWPTISNQFS